MAKLLAIINPNLDRGLGPEEVFLATAQAVVEARRRYEDGDTAGVPSWTEWARTYIHCSMAYVIMLSRIGNAPDPAQALRTFREGRRVYYAARRAGESAPPPRLPQIGKQARRGWPPGMPRSTRPAPPARLTLRPSDPRDHSKTDHVEREYTNLITVWMNSGEPARLRFLRAVGLTTVRPNDDDGGTVVEITETRR
jgi:hypothetical protein